jgi:ribonuclease BN (tRNA processing enzyme)
MVEITFVGTGCAFASPRRGNLAFVVDVPGARMLVEAGPAVVAQMMAQGLELEDVDCLFVSHAHGDHALGFPVLALQRLEAAKPLMVTAGANTVERLEAFCTLSFPGLGLNRKNIAWQPLSESTVDTVDLTPSVLLRTTPVPHPPGVPTLAARWDVDGGPSITYVTDTVPNEAVLRLAKGSDLLIHDATYSAVLQPDVDSASYSHSTAKQAGEVARAAGCARLALVHLGSPGAERPDVLAAEARADSDLEIVVPDDGERLRL